MKMGTYSSPPAVLYILLLSPLASCVPGVSLHLVPNLPLIKVDSGSEVTLQCILNGDSQVTTGYFSWTFRQLVTQPLRSTEDGHVRIEESISGVVSTLTINRVNRSDEGEYTCSYTSLEPVSITVDVVVDPHFKSVSTRQEFSEGTDAVVHCPAFLGDPAGQMFWFRNNQVIRDIGNRFIQSPEQLTIQNARIDDSGTYQCALYRNGILGTENITVVVQERSALAPRIVDPEIPIEVTYGQPLDLMCRLVEEEENVRYTWTVDTTYERNHFVNTTPRLYRESNDFVGGRYLCKAENEYGYDEQLFLVNILAPPLPANCSARPETREEGVTIVLEYCILTSPVQPSELTFKWSKQRQNGERINIMDDGKKYSINSEGVLTITNTQLSDSGMYLVNISNSQGFAVHVVQLTVIRPLISSLIMPPLPANCSAPPETREEGATIVLEYCTLTSPVQPSELTFQWSKQRQNGERINIMEDGMKYSINSEGVLTITNAQPSDSGMYLVNISNSQGFAVHMVQLTVFLPPLPANCSARPETREEGATIVLEYCTLTSSVQLSELTFQWSKQGQNGERINIIEDGMKYSINSEGVLSITNTQLSDSGTYLVNISNNQGFALHTVHLEVTVRSKNPSATTSQTEIGLIVGGVLAACMLLWCVLWCLVVVCYRTYKSQVYQRRQQVVHIKPRPVLRAQLQAAEELEMMEQIPASHLNIECDRISNLPTSNVEHPEHFIWCNLGHLKFM